MKTIKQIVAGVALLLPALFSACGGAGSYPLEYIGFEKSTQEVEFNPSLSEYVFTAKIIAGDKSTDDRTLSITGNRKPGETGQVFTIETPTVTIAAKQKAAEVKVKIYPPQIKGRRDIILTCTPKNITGAKSTQLRVTLTPAQTKQKN
ncbi:MAG: hypothetical protein LBL78_05165 [Prevotellaceae bacterium]|jgi:hypothetical protein|nr:hypothetical protein [Prevotellaceae bacterium]